MKTKLILKIQQEIAILKEKLATCHNHARQEAANLATTAVSCMNYKTPTIEKRLLNIEKRLLGHVDRYELLKKKIAEVEQFLETL